MGELLQSNWALVAVIAAALLLVFFWLLAANRKTRIEVAPGEDGDGQARRNQALIDAAPAATHMHAAAVPLMEPDAVAIPVPDEPAAPQPDTGDDLLLIKGLGPKIAQQLATLGVTRFSQIAAWDDAEIDRIDVQLGRFQGRIRRDSWVEQAQLLAAGDRSGFEDRFGRS